MKDYLPEFYNLIMEYLNKPDTALSQDNWNIFSTQINELSKAIADLKIQIYMRKASSSNGILRLVNYTLTMFSKIDLLKDFSKLFDPDMNDFVLQTTRNFKPGNERKEIWTDGPAYLVSLPFCKDLGLSDED